MFKIKVLTMYQIKYSPCSGCRISLNITASCRWSKREGEIVHISGCGDGDKNDISGGGDYTFGEYNISSLVFTLPQGSGALQLERLHWKQPENNLALWTCITIFDYALVLAATSLPDNNVQVLLLIAKVQAHLVKTFLSAGHLWASVAHSRTELVTLPCLPFWCFWIQKKLITLPRKLNHSPMPDAVLTFLNQENLICLWPSHACRFGIFESRTNLICVWRWLSVIFLFNLDTAWHPSIHTNWDCDWVISFVCMECI